MNIKQRAIAVSLGLSLLTTSSFATDIAMITGGSTNNAYGNLANIAASGNLTPGDGADTLVGLSFSDFNAMSVASLLAAYDTIVMPWYVPGSGGSDMNADWNTRLLPYLNGGGRILWEDPENIADLAASGIGLSGGNIYGGVGEGDISLVAPFGDAGASGFYHIHYSISSASAAWDVWSTDINGKIHGVYGEFGSNGGRMVLGVSDNLYHPDFNFAGEADHRALTLNQLNWLNTGAVSGVVPDSGASLMLLGLGLGALAVARRRVAA
jgi:hypothetical protein